MVLLLIIVVRQVTCWCVCNYPHLPVSPIVAVMLTIILCGQMLVRCIIRDLNLTLMLLWSRKTLNGTWTIIWRQIWIKWQRLMRVLMQKEPVSSIHVRERSRRKIWLWVLILWLNGQELIRKTVLLCGIKTMVAEKQPVIILKLNK